MGGKRLQNIEDADEVIVGRYYLVPTVCVNPRVAVLRCVPITGPLHEDAEFINFPARHYHPDRRFVSQSWFDYYGTGFTGMAGHWSAVYSFKIPTLLSSEERDTGMFETGRKRMQCKRIVEPFRKDAPWLMKLEKAYAGEKLREGMICPHRGISCRGVKVDEKGCVVCPGHGLQFRVADGNLVSRIGQTLTPNLFK